MNRGLLHCVVVLVCICSNGLVPAADWTRFRGPNGAGISGEPVPVKWNDSANLKWKASLPGPGLSSPIIVGDRIIVTCWSGYADGSGTEGSLDRLKRHVICVDRGTGDIVWNHAEDAVLPEDSFRGMFAENGYASHTPATDGKRVYAFLGKSGVIALNLADGKPLWRTGVGENRERRGWGSASSPIVHGRHVIVPAFIEGDALLALDAETGDVAWKQEVPGYTSNWSTPILVPAGQRTDLVLSVPGEVWGLNPDNGKLRWYCEIPGSDDSRSSVIADGSMVIAMAGGRGANASIAVKAGGKGDVADTMKVWQGRDASGISTPLVHGDRLYVVSNNVLTVVDLQSGNRIRQIRMSGGSNPSADRSSREGRSPRPGGDDSNGRAAGSYRRGPGGQDYSSPIVAGHHLYYTSRQGDTFVYDLTDDVHLVAVNRFGDPGEYNATPAAADGQLFVRSTRFLYCIAAD